MLSAITQGLFLGMLRLLYYKRQHTLYPATAIRMRQIPFPNRPHFPTDQQVIPVGSATEYSLPKKMVASQNNIRPLDPSIPFGGLLFHKSVQYLGYLA